MTVFSWGNHVPLKTCLTFRLLLLLLTSVPAWSSGVISNDTLQRKMLLGYQGWFSCPGDGSGLERWHHWFRGHGPGMKLTVEMWPDTRESDADELFATPFALPDGRPAAVFSSAREKTVVRHFQWMEEAGIDGILLQRFVGEIQDPRFREFRNQVTRHVRTGAERHGRVFALEYDLSAQEAGQLKADWMALVDEMKITDSPRYLRHRGKPLLGVWGFGFKERGGTPREAMELLDWLRNTAPERYRATVIGGVPAGWRTGTGDSHPGPEWAAVYRAFDIISPWTVGRYHEDAAADRYAREMMGPDMAEAARAGREYLPVVFPGFSWKNLHDGPLNQIPRRGGRFYWNQVVNAVSSGNTMLKVAMFNEVDEGTAMFKLVPTTANAPVGVPILTLDADGETLPSDWYLRLSGETSRLLRGEIPARKDLPIRP